MHLVPIEIHIQGIDISNFEAQMMTMMKPTYTSIIQHEKEGKLPLVFVPTQKHAQLTSLDMVMHSNAHCEERSQFLQCTKEDLAPFIKILKEYNLSKD